GDDERVRSAIADQRQRQITQQDELRDVFSNQYNDAYVSDRDLRNQITGDLTNFNPSYNADDYLKAAGYISGGGGVGSGGSGGAGYSIVGGIDPSKISGMGAEAYAGYKDMSQGLKEPFW